MDLDEYVDTDQTSTVAMDLGLAEYIEPVNTASVIPSLELPVATFPIPPAPPPPSSLPSTTSNSNNIEHGIPLQLDEFDESKPMHTTSKYTTPHHSNQLNDKSAPPPRSVSNTRPPPPLLLSSKLTNPVAKAIADLPLGSGLRHETKKQASVRPKRQQLYDKFLGTTTVLNCMSDIFLFHLFFNTCAGALSRQRWKEACPECTCAVHCLSKEVNP